jgi:hypothetical protein
MRNLWIFLCVFVWLSIPTNAQNGFRKPLRSICIFASPGAISANRPAWMESRFQRSSGHERYLYGTLGFGIA